MIGSICTDGSPVISGNRSDFVAMLKKKISELKMVYCLLHRQALNFKTLPPYLKDALNSWENRELHQRSCFESTIVSIGLPRC